MIRLEKKEFEHKGFPCAIMKMEYANLKELKEKDLLLQGDKGQWLWLCIGLTELTEKQAKQLKNKILDEFLDASMSKKDETHPELTKNLFENNTQINHFLHFTMNRFRYPRFKENHQLDEKLCKEYMDKLIDMTLEKDFKIMLDKMGDTMNNIKENENNEATKAFNKFQAFAKEMIESSTENNAALSPLEKRKKFETFFDKNYRHYDYTGDNHLNRRISNYAKMAYRDYDRYYKDYDYEKSSKLFELIEYNLNESQQETELQETIEKFFVKELNNPNEIPNKYEIKMGERMEIDYSNDTYKKNPYAIEESVENYLTFSKLYTKMFSLFDYDPKVNIEKESIIQDQEKLIKELYDITKAQKESYSKKYGLEDLKELFNSKSKIISYYDNKNRAIREKIIKPIKEVILKIALNNYKILDDLKTEKKILENNHENYISYEKLLKSKKEIKNENDLENYKYKINKIYNQKEENYFKDIYPKIFKKLEKEYENLNILTLSRLNQKNMSR